MNRTAVLALDLSPAAEPLLECAAELRRWRVGHLVITHVVRMGYGQEPGERALRRSGSGWRGGRLACAAPLCKSRSRFAPPRSPADGIIAMSNEAKADLIVLGLAQPQPGQSALPRQRRTRHGPQDAGAVAAGMARAHRSWRGARLRGGLRRYPASCPAGHRPVEACRCGGGRRRCAWHPNAQRVDCLAVLTPDAIAASRPCR